MKTGAGAHKKLFSQLSKTHSRKTLLPYLESILQLCNERGATFNEIVGSMGRLYFNGDGKNVDFANMYDR